MKLEILEKLKNLQDILYSIYKMDKEINEIPASLSTTHDLVQRLKLNYIDVSNKSQKKLAKIERLTNNLDLTVKERESFESQMAMLPPDSTKESESFDKIIQATCQKEKELRDALKKEKVEHEELKAKMNSQEALIESNEKQYDSLQIQVNSQLDDKKSQLEELKKIKNELTLGMDEDLIFKFDRIIRNKEGKGIVPIKDKVCTGCNMLLPAQFANDIHSHLEIHFCPYCSRILFFEETENADENYAFSDVDAGGLIGEFEDVDSDF